MSRFMPFTIPRPALPRCWRRMRQAESRERLWRHCHAAGYTASALVSVWPTNAGSQFVVGFQRDRNIGIAATNVLSTQTLVSIAALSIANAAPPNAVSVHGHMSGISTTTSTGALSVYASSAGVGQQLLVFGVAANEGTSTTFSVSVSVAQEIYYAMTNSSGTSTGSISNIRLYHLRIVKCTCSFPTRRRL